MGRFAEGPPSSGSGLAGVVPAARPHQRGATDSTLIVGEGPRSPFPLRLKVITLRKGWAAGSTDIAIGPAAPPLPGWPSEPGCPSNLQEPGGGSRCHPSRATSATSVGCDFERAAVGIGQVERLASAADHFNLQQWFGPRLHPDPGVNWLSSAPVPTVAPIAAVAPVGVSQCNSWVGLLAVLRELGYDDG